MRVSFKPVPGGYDFADTVRFTIVRVLIAVGDTEADTDDVVPVAGTRKVTLHFSPSEMLRPANHGPLTVYLSPRPRGNSPAWVQIVDESDAQVDSLTFTAYTPSAVVHARGVRTSVQVNDLGIRAQWHAIPPYMPPKVIDVGTEDVTVFRMTIENPVDSNADVRAKGSYPECWLDGSSHSVCERGQS